MIYTPAAETEHLIETLLHSPRLAVLARKLDAIIASEQTERQRFYDEVTENQKAEFINGEVIVHSPVKLMHSMASDRLAMLLNAYVTSRRLGHVGHEKLLVSLSRNDYEPDICFWSRTKSDQFTPLQSKFPAPDLVVEVISESTEKIDRGLKFDDYAFHGISEYWIVDPEHETIEQYWLANDTYTLAVKVKIGLIVSQVVAGFEIPAQAVFNPIENLTALRAILQGE